MSGLRATPRATLAWCVALALVLLAFVRLADIRTFPILSVDEGLYTLQAKDAARFHDAGMNGLRHNFLSPLSYEVLRALFSAAPPTIFSARTANGVFGLLTLWLVWRMLAARVSPWTALAGVLTIGLSFTMVTMNRRAYLESGVMLLSAFAMLCAMKPGRRHLAGLAAAVAGLLLYKSNAAYILPALLLPGSGERFGRGVAVRTLAVAAGVLAALVVFFLLFLGDPVAFRSTFAFELLKGAAEPGWLKVGRFGVYPAQLAASMPGVLRGYTDLALLSAVGLIALRFRRSWQDFFVERFWIWLVGGYFFLMAQSFQHAQYFSPLIVPAGVLALVVFAGVRQRNGLARGTAWIGLAVFLAFCMIRLGAGWNRADASNPPLRAVAWIDAEPLGDRGVLACPEVAAATEKRTYAYHRIFFPYAPNTPPSMEAFIRDKQIGAVVIDEWETPTVILDPAVFAPVRRYPLAATGDGWVAYRVPEPPGSGPGGARAGDQRQPFSR